MKKTLLLLGTSSIGLASIVPFFKNSENCEIYLINDDTAFDDENHVFYWSNLQLHKSYLIGPELGSFKECVEVSGVIDSFNFEKIERLISTDEVVYLCLNLKQASENDRELISRILVHRQSLKFDSPLVILSINDDEILSLVFRDARTATKNIHFRNVLFIECITDILYSVPTHKHDQCIVYREILHNNKIFVDHRTITFIEKNKHKDIVQQTFNHNTVIFFDKNSSVKKRFKIYATLKYLLAILTIDADHLYIYGYLRFGDGAKRIAETIMSELLKICSVRGIEMTYGLLFNYYRRLDNFGSNVTQILPLTNTAELAKVYEFLIDILDEGILQYNDEHVNEVKMIPYVLSLLKDQLD